MAAQNDGYEFNILGIYLTCLREEISKPGISRMYRSSEVERTSGEPCYRGQSLPASLRMISPSRWDTRKFVAAW
jgi:hypothetical protein